MKTYYISDLHIDDQRIFDKCHRPFKDLVEMRCHIKSKWNSKITNADEVYVLGDLVEDGSIPSIEFFRGLNGHKHLIIGNHDLKVLDAIRDSGIFESLSFMALIQDEGRKVCLCHYPVMDWMEFNRQGILVYGHIHNKTEDNGLAYKEIKNYYKTKPAYNCGVDVTNFEPVTLDEMIALKEANKNEAYIN